MLQFYTRAGLKVEVICSVTAVANDLRDEQQNQQGRNDFPLSGDVRNSPRFQAAPGADGGGFKAQAPSCRPALGAPRCGRQNGRFPGAGGKGSLCRGVLHISGELLLLLGMLELLPVPWDIRECLHVLMPPRPSCAPALPTPAPTVLLPTEQQSHNQPGDGRHQPSRSQKIPALVMLQPHFLPFLLPSICAFRVDKERPNPWRGCWRESHPRWGCPASSSRVPTQAPTAP